MGIIHFNASKNSGTHKAGHIMITMSDRPENIDYAACLTERPREGELR